jgi:predicted ATP-dependent serine protease
MKEPTTFICNDCGAHVATWCELPVWPRCSTCQWISENVLPEDEDAVRERMGVPLR